MGENNLKDFLLQLPIYLQIEQDNNKSEYINYFHQPVKPAWQ